MSPRDPKDLSKRAVEILKLLAENEDNDDGGGEIVVEGVECWIGLEKTGSKTVNQLLECCFITDDGQWEVEKIKRYRINGSGKRFLAGLPPYFDGDGKAHDTLFSIINERRTA